MALLTERHRSIQTPWGPSQDSYYVSEGIDFYSTASHGGYLLSPERNAEVRPEWRTKDRWYEEDCEWARVCMTFPDAFPADAMVVAQGMLANCPDWFKGSVREPGSR